jgi:hypothetical protein
MSESPISDTMKKCDPYCMPVYIHIVISIIALSLNIYNKYSTAGIGGADIGQILFNVACNVLCFFIIKTLCISCDATLAWLLILCPLMCMIFQLTVLIRIGARQMIDKGPTKGPTKGPI